MGELQKYFYEKYLFWVVFDTFRSFFEANTVYSKVIILRSIEETLKSSIMHRSENIERGW